MGTVARLSGDAVRPLLTLDPADPLDDLGWLDEAIGDARVVAIGESAHYNREFYELRHRLLRYLVQRHGFSVYAMESGYVEGWRVDDWVRGGDTPLGDVLANAMTSLMGMWTPMRAHLEWMRTHNETAARPVGFTGIDLGGSNVSLLSGLDAVTDYLRTVDPDHHCDADLRDTVTTFAAPSAFGIPAAQAAYAGLPQHRRDALTAGLADLVARLTSQRLDYRRRGTPGAHRRALRSLHNTVTIDSVLREVARGNVAATITNRDAAMADTVDAILTGGDRVVVAAHNGHIQRWPTALPGMAPAVPMGMHLADRLGTDYRVIGTTSGAGQVLSSGFFAGTLFEDMAAPQPGSLDALFAASHDGPFGVDLRTVSAADRAIVQAATTQRMGPMYTDVSPCDAYDLIVHLPTVTAAEPDADAVANAPDEVRDAFATWASIRRR